jgi:hypothetical protein
LFFYELSKHVEDAGQHGIAPLPLELAASTDRPGPTASTKATQGQQQQYLAVATPQSRADAAIMSAWVAAARS